MLKLAIQLAVAAIVHGVLQLKWFLFPFTFLVIYIVCGGWKTARAQLLVVWRDLRFIIRSARFGRYINKVVKENRTVGDCFSKICQQHPSKTALVSADFGYSLSFADAETLTNHIANVFLERGYQYGDTIALLMDGCPEYVCCWLGLGKIGITTALINTNLFGDALAHCLKITKARALIYGIEYEAVVNHVKPLIKEDEEVTYYCFNRNEEGSPFLLGSYSAVTEPPRPTELTEKSKLFYIFTSGTTGLPKAAIVSHTRFFASMFIPSIFGLKNDEIIYNTLPLYHSAGGMGATSCCILRGNTLVIKKKFSAGSFFDDCRKYQCTTATYIGEICRYLLNKPQGEKDKDHKLRRFMGCGISKSIWKNFQSRFNIPEINEFYGCTEGIALFNTTGLVGSVGFIPQLLPQSLVNALVKIDLCTYEVIRGSDNFASRCKPGELGELLAPIRKGPIESFEGYLDKNATTNKQISDVFKSGDFYTRSGDIFTSDEFGNLFFCDRIGDTFRWKSENVSTAEVEAQISKAIGLKDVMVYGVKIPGNEGKAGMVAIDDKKGEEKMNTLASELSNILPPYAMPVFVRFTNSIKLTGTFKYKKTEMRQEGYDLSKVNNDPIFVFIKKESRYVKLDETMYQKILNSEIQF